MQRLFILLAGGGLIVAADAAQTNSATLIKAGHLVDVVAEKVLDHQMILVEGDSIPQLFIPRLVELWRQGKFPVDRIVSTYDFDAIDQAVHDAEAGKVIKTVLVMS